MNIHDQKRLNDKLHLAAGNGILCGVKFALAAGAFVDSDDGYALRWSASDGYYEIVETLFKAGADLHILNGLAFKWCVDQIDNHSNRPITDDRIKIVKLFLREGCYDSRLIKHVDKFDEETETLIRLMSV